MQGKSPIHQPVLLREMMEYLVPQNGDVFVDGTLGMGGAASLAAKAVAPDGLFIGLDKDSESLDVARKNLNEIKGKKELIHADFRNMKDVLAQLGIPQADKIFLDLGISSYQLDQETRGFSFDREGPLDMRMDRSQGLTAAEVINQFPEKELADLIYFYGEERYARRIARRLVYLRETKPFETTKDLAEAVKGTLRGTVKTGHSRIHPATRTFQALRIYVNQELDSLEMFLKEFISILKPGGRIGIISFHSLEDRLVKTAFKREAGQCVCDAPVELCQCPRIENIRLITRKPVVPKEDETEANPRARSAKFRVAERLNNI
jgi:16S rRNA (cytosine1402-N4)-methyltransferase